MFDLKKTFPRLLTIILFAACAFLIIHPFRWSQALNMSLYLFLNFMIILAATYFGTKGVMTFGLAGFLAVFLRSLRVVDSSIFPTVLVGITIAIFYSFCLKLDRFARRVNAELDNIEEEKNVLNMELEHLRLDNATLKQKLQRYTMLKNLTETLSSTLYLDKAVSLITDGTFQIIGKSNAGFLYLVDKEKQGLNLVSKKLADSKQRVQPAPDHKDGLEVQDGDIFDGWVFRQRTPLMVMDTKRDFRFNIQNAEDVQLEGVRSLIAAPLISENKLLGIIRLDSVTQKAYHADDLRLLDIISDLAAVVIENVMLYQEMERLAITDGLTGLFVHRHFQERFEQEISRAIWTNSQFAFLMIDIDDFKSYNDRYGHIAGDIVLKQIAKLMSLNVNPGDIVARYGGEEFGVLLVDTSKPEALKIAERIRERIEDKKFIFRRQITQIRISGGMSFFPEDGREKESLIQKADQALYRAKAQEKNRICIF